MNEIKKEVRTFMTSLQCDCGGEYIYDHSRPVMLTLPAQHPYTCNKCGNKITSTGIYPQIEYEDMKYF